MNKRTPLLKSFVATFIFMIFAAQGVFAQTFQDAMKLYNYGKRDEGIAALQQINQTNPGDVFTAFELARILTLRDKAAEASAIFDRMAGGDPKAPSTLIGQGAKLMLANNAVEGKKILDKAWKAVRRDPNMIRMVGEALILGQNADFTKAFEYFQDAANKTKSLESYIAFGRAKVLEAQAKSTGNVGDAITQFEYAVELFPTDPVPPMQVANLFYRVKNYDEAEKWYLRAIQRDAKFGPALRELAEMAYEAPGQNQWTKAKNYYKQLLEVLPERESDWLRYFNAMYFSRPKDCAGILETAPKFYNRFQESPDNLYLIRLQSECTLSDSNGGTDQPKVLRALELINDFKSKAAAEKVLATDYELLGDSYRYLKQDSVSIAHYKKVLEMDPTKRYIYDLMAPLAYNIAVQKAQIAPPPANIQEYWDTAALYFTEKIKNAGDKAKDQDFLILTNTYYYGKRYLKADSTAAILVSMRPDLPTAYYLRGTSSENYERDQLIEKGIKPDAPEYKKELAKPYFEKFIESALAVPDPTRYKATQLPRAYNYLVEHYMINKDWLNAKIYLEKYLELKPDEQRMKDMLQQVNNGGKPIAPPPPPRGTQRPANGARPAGTTGATATTPARPAGAAGTTTTTPATKPAATTTPTTRPRGN